MPFKFKFSKVVIIESLEDHEVKTGRQVEEQVKGLIAEIGKETPVEYISCDNIYEFQNVIRNLTNQALNGAIPLVHIECHGDILEGLEFKNGTTIGWGALAEIISPLNLATGFNLVLCMSACHAGEFLGEMGGVMRPCPCRVMIAPSLEVNPAECMMGFRVFYRKLFDTLVLEDAIKEIESLKLEHGQWFGEYAEKWFMRIARDYVRYQCTKKAVRARVMSIYLELKKIGIDTPLHKVKRDFLKSLRLDAISSMYEQFFAVKDYPSLGIEFEHVLIGIRRYVDQQRKAGLCAI